MKRDEGDTVALYKQVQVKIEAVRSLNKMIGDKKLKIDAGGER